MSDKPEKIVRFKLILNATVVDKSGLSKYEILRAIEDANIIELLQRSEISWSEIDVESVDGIIADHI